MKKEKLFALAVGMGCCLLSTPIASQAMTVSTELIDGTVECFTFDLPGDGGVTENITDEEWSLAEDALWEEDYEEIGMVKDEEGYWLWKGDSVCLILDDNGSMTQYGGVANREDKVYLHIIRDEDGNAAGVEAVTAKEILKELALRDLLKDE